MKSFFALLLPLVLVGCGSDSSPDVSDKSSMPIFPVKTAKPTPETPNTSPLSQKDAVGAIEFLGGSVQFDATSGDVIQVRLSGRRRISDGHLRYVKDLTTLTTLTLAANLTDAGLVHLKGLTRLKHLHLSGPQITDAGLEHVKGLTGLTTLVLSGTQITGSGLVHLKGLTNLTSLVLSGTQFYDAEFESLKAWTGREVKTAKPTPETPNTSPLSQKDAVGAIEFLGGSVQFDATSGDVIQVRLSGRRRISDGHLRYVKDLTTLTTLTLAANLTDAGLVHLKGLTRLKHLHLSGPQITDAGLEHVKGLTDDPRPLRHADHGVGVGSPERTDESDIPRPLRHAVL